MGKKRIIGIGGIVIIALLLLAVAWFLASQSFQAVKETVLDQPDPRHLLVVGLSLLLALLGAAYALLMSYHARRSLEKEIETKTGELQRSNEKLRDTLDALLDALDTVGEMYAFQQSIIDGMAAPLVVIGLDYRIKLMNRVAREFSYGDSDEAKPEFCYQASHRYRTPCREMGLPCPIEQVRESGQPVTVVHEHYRANGRLRFVEIIATPLWGGDGSLQGIIEVLRDITRRKQEETALAQRMQAVDLPYDELEQFSSQVVRSIQDLFAHLPLES